MKILIDISRTLSRDVDSLSFASPVSHVYNPLAYARTPHEQYLARYGSGLGRVVMVGMNPGPFGMAQTGVPFGDVVMAREFLGIEADVGRPSSEHPKRPVEGFECRRREVSGTRVWSWARERYTTPERFFSRFFVLNYCPLVFIEHGGKNRTPDKLPVSERGALFAACDKALEAVVEALEPSIVIGIGAFARRRCDDVLDGRFPTGTILHPSPASPAANRGWAARVDEQLAEMGIEC